MIGLICLISVHTSPPDWIKEFRSFDVPLMVFISAMCFKMPYGGYVDYIIKRFKRIYIPVLVFLTIFFSFFCVIYKLVGKPYFDISQVAGSYLLLNRPSIGYVWIMRVFLICAVLLPLLKRYLYKINTSKFIILITIILIVQELLVSLNPYIKNPFFNMLYSSLVPYTVGYTPFLILGLNIRQFSLKSRWILILSIIFFTVFILWINKTSRFYPSHYKYPPTGIFITYGLIGCILLYMSKPLISLKITGSRIVMYFGKNSMWLYLWHIFVLQFANTIKGNELFLVRFLVVICASVFCQLIFSKFIHNISLKLAKMISC